MVSALFAIPTVVIAVLLKNHCTPVMIIPGLSLHNVLLFILSTFIQVCLSRRFLLVHVVMVTVVCVDIDRCLLAITFMCRPISLLDMEQLTWMSLLQWQQLLHTLTRLV